MTPEERQTRLDLAAAYRLAVVYGWTDLNNTHFSARIPGTDEFLLNPFGLLFDEITASSLIKLDRHGNILGTSDYPANPAGFVIHSAIHRARHDVGCVIHTHTAAGLAVAAQKHGLLPLSQHAMRFTDCIAYHDYEGVALDLPEQRRLVRDLGQRNVMILRNHGLLACGATVAEAFDRIYYLERACQAQIGAMAGGAALSMPKPAIARKVARQFARPGRTAPGNAWTALLRLLDRIDPSYKS